MQRTRKKKSNAFESDGGKIEAMACGTNSKWQPTDKCYMHALKFLWNETKKEHILVVHGADNLLPIEKLSIRKKVFAHNKSQETDIDKYMRITN